MPALSCPIIIPDTSFLLTCPQVHRLEWRLCPLEIVIPDTVMHELQGLARDKDALRAGQASQALAEIEGMRTYAARQGQDYYRDENVTVRLSPDPSAVKSPLDARIPDHRIIALARQQALASPPRFCAILTRDRELCDIAETLSVLVVIPDRDGKFHYELERKYTWWKKIQEAGPGQALGPTPPAPGPTGAPKRKSGEPPDPRLRLDRFVQHVYGRVRAARYRAILSLYPLPARLGLAVKIIQRVPKPGKRVVLLIVESDAAARYWAREIRKRCELPVAKVPIFGLDDVERIEKARVVIYRHDQVGRRLPVHLPRLKLAGQRLTAIVDGCDLLDPVDLAQLLFECDQFVGLNRYALDYAEAPGSRMLNTFLQGRALFTYSFADAERDGWGHSVDLYRHAVRFAPDELAEWEKKKAEYVPLRETAVRRYPELKDADDFWAALNQVLCKAAVPDIARLVPLREDIELAAHIARNKADVVHELLTHTPHQPCRRLIFDYNRTWTPVLLKQLERNGLQAAELPRAADEQRPVWDRFTGGKLEVLLLSEAPALDLPGAHFHQLILLTPLREMAEISAMVDWALTHTLTRDALRVDVLYVQDTPEELAMLELAEACFGLRYEKKS